MTLQKLSDEKLMALIKKGDRVAFDEIYNRYAKRLLIYFYRMLNSDESKAQDFLQDIFLKVIEKPKRYKEKSRFSTWIFAVAHNMCRNEYRRMHNRSVVELSGDLDLQPMPFDFDNPEQMVLNKEFRALVLDCLSDLDIDKQSTFLLRFQEQLSLDEIASILNCKTGTVKSRLFYTSRHVAKKLRALHYQIQD